MSHSRLSLCVSQVKVAYVNFVNHCYVDTEVEMKEIYTSNHIWKLFEDFTVDMARVRTQPSDWTVVVGARPPLTLAFSSSAGLQ